MRILNVEAINFGSYKRLEFDLTDAGLTLIQGANGSGKSTLCDLVPWILFGQTAKNGAADEVISWDSEGLTSATAIFELQGEIHAVFRSRGKSKDLYYWKGHGDPVRGKDLVDTQRMINQLLRMDIDTYLAGAYFHEFSQTAQFFTTSAKNRRAITEQLADLTLAKSLELSIANQTKVLKAAHDQTVKRLDLAVQKQNQLTLDIYALESASSAWETKHSKDQAALELRASNFESQKVAKIKELETKRQQHEDQRFDRLEEARKAIQTYKTLIQPVPSTDLFPKCRECGQNVHSDELQALRDIEAANALLNQKIEAKKATIVEIKLMSNPFDTQLALAKNQTNTAEHLISAVQYSNPHPELIAVKNADLEANQSDLSNYEASASALRAQIDDLQLLREVTVDMRSASILATISAIQMDTNKLLRNHFDAEISVEFDVQAADKVEVIIYKDGNLATFTQLSKGQRQLLKLCFGVSVMQAVANHSGVSPRQIFFDEALDGLSEEFKAKAYQLFVTLAPKYESIYIVEHSPELRTKFDNSYSVTLVEGHSQLEKN